jgi:L-threonylcarbamoyladenylate synthase
MAEIISFSPLTIERIADRVQQAVREGGIVAIPTETYYGLGVDPFNDAAVERLARVKGRSDARPILVLIGSLEQLPLVAQVVPSVAEILIEEFWPGSLTILFPARPSLPHNLTAGTGLVGIRLSPCKSLCTLLCHVGPLTGTSANRADRPPAQTARMVERELGSDVDVVVDAGRTAGGLPSTVIDARLPIRVIREGAVTRQKIQDVLQTHGISLV